LPKLPWDLAVGGCAAHEFRAYQGAEQNAGIGVPEKKKKLLIGIRRVQRGCGSGDGGREKADHRRQSIGQSDSHRIATPNAGRRQGVCHGQDLLPERIVGDTNAKLGDDHGRVTVREM
jgi:hypothetical protein